MEKKVIKVDFSKKKRVEEEPEKKEPIDIGEDLGSFIKQMGEYAPGNLLVELVLAGVNVGDRIGKLIKNTENFSQNVYLERKERVRSYPNEQLIQEFAKSDYSQWHKDPAFYRAIVNEIQERIKMLTKNDE